MNLDFFVIVEYVIIIILNLNNVNIFVVIICVLGRLIIRGLNKRGNFVFCDYNK